MTASLTVGENGVGHIELRRPDRRNAIDLEMARALSARALECQWSPEVRAVMLSGAGDAFCVGGDLSYMLAAEDHPGPQFRELVDELHTAVRRLSELEAPIVVVVQGAAAGAGLSLVCLGDIVIAAENASFTVAYTAVGLSPDGGCTWTLPRIVGMRMARELALTNARLSAQEALGLGLVSRVTAPETLASTAAGVAEQLASGARGAQAGVRRLMRASAESSFSEHLDLEAATIVGLGVQAEARERITAFLEKRPPRL